MFNGAVGVTGDQNQPEQVFHYKCSNNTKQEAATLLWKLHM